MEQAKNGSGQSVGIAVPGERCRDATDDLRNSTGFQMLRTAAHIQVGGSVVRCDEGACVWGSPARMDVARLRAVLADDLDQGPLTLSDRAPLPVSQAHSWVNPRTNSVLGR